MFDEILKTVKEHLADNPQVAAAIPADKLDAVHNEIANHVANTLSGGGAAAGGGGILGTIENAISSGNPAVTAIEGGLIGSLTSKLGLGSAATGAISAALPGLLQKFISKQ